MSGIPFFETASIALSALSNNVLGSCFKCPFAEVCRVFHREFLGKILPFSFKNHAGCTSLTCICNALNHVQRAETTVHNLRDALSWFTVVQEIKIPVYTDGSQSGSEVGVPTIFLNCVLVHFLPKTATIFTAEI